MLKEITWYYNNEIKKDSEEENSVKTKPRLSIAFSEFKKTPALNSMELNTSNYIINRNEKMTLSDKYKTYKLIDQRLHIN